MMRWIVLLSILVFTSCSTSKNSKSTELTAVQPKATETEYALEKNEVVRVNAEEKEDFGFRLAGEWSISRIMVDGRWADLPYDEWNMQIDFGQEPEGRFAIQTSCNSGGCDFVVQDTEIKIGLQCFFSEMYCEDEQKNVWERKLTEALQDLSRIKYVSGDEIALLEGNKYAIELRKI